MPKSMSIEFDEWKKNHEKEKTERKKTIEKDEEKTERGRSRRMLGERWRKCEKRVWRRRKMKKKIVGNEEMEEKKLYNGKRWKKKKRKEIVGMRRCAKGRVRKKRKQIVGQRGEGNRQNEK